MSDTPETDAAEIVLSPLEGDQWVRADVARRLERERNIAFADINLLCDKVLELNTLLQAHGIIEHEN